MKRVLSRSPIGSKPPLTVRQAAALVWDLARGVRILAIVSLAANLVAAMFEGSTIGILVAAIQVLGRPQVSLGATFGEVGRWLDGIRLAVGPENLFFGLVLSAVAAQVLRSGLQFAGQVATVSLGVRVETEAHHRIFRRMMQLEFPRVSRYPLGDLTDQLSQTTALQEILSQFNLLVRSVLLVTMYALALVWLSWPMTLLVLPTYWLVSRFLRRVISTVGAHSSRLTATAVMLNQRTTESLQALRLIHSFAQQEQTVHTVERLARARMHDASRALVWGSTVEPVMDMLTVCGGGLLLVIGYFLLAPHGTPLPHLLALLLALHRMTPRLGSVHGSLTTLAIYLPRLARLEEILAGEADPPAASAAGAPFHGLTRAIAFRGVSLQYRADEAPAVHDLSFQIPRGSLTALVGASGSGKSSVADLIVRLYEPTAGKILVDGRDLHAFHVASWRSHLGVVSQDVFLFHATIRENILFGRSDATERDVLEAARAAHADTFIARLADGLDTMVGDRGYGLSGGERQRIALARALIRQPELLLLDEATSSLDSESERSIQRVLNEQRGNRTLVVIAHRLSTIAHADQILVLHAGQLVEQGTHGTLLARDGIYARLWQLQSQSEEPPRQALLEGAVS